MKEIKVLHTADLHLDTPFSSLKNFNKNRQEELREVFIKIIDIVKEEKVDVLLIAGDLFDSENVTKITLKLLKDKLLEIPEVYKFISPGNHDFYYNGSLYKHFEGIKNLHIYKDKLEIVNIDELNISIYGYGFTQKYSQERILKDFIVKDDSKINIMVTHGDARKTASIYNPIDYEDIRYSGFDYIALGHIHKYSGIQSIGSTCYAYSGNPQGRSFNETGDKGALLLNIKKGYVKETFIKTHFRKYLIYNIDISSLGSYRSIREKILEGIEDEDFDKNYYRIILTGEILEGFNMEVDILEERLKEFFHYIEILDKTSIKFDYLQLLENNNLKSLTIKNIIESTEDDEIKKLAIKYSLEALDKGVVEET